MSFGVFLCYGKIHSIRVPFGCFASETRFRFFGASVLGFLSFEACGGFLFYFIRFILLYLIYFIVLDLFH